MGSVCIAAPSGGETTAVVSIPSSVVVMEVFISGNLDPQDMQNLAPSRFSLPHSGQNIAITQHPFQDSYHAIRFPIG